MTPNRLPAVFISVALALLPLSGCVAPARAGIEAETLRVNSLTVLRKSDTPHVYSNIIVDLGGVLQVEAGVHIQLTPGASFVVDGALRAMGTVMDRIYVEPLQPDTVWQVFHATRNCLELNLSFVSFLRFQEPVYVESKAFAISNVLVEDGVYNVLHLGSPGATYHDTDVSFVTFSNRLQGRNMKDNGMFLEGSFGRLRIMDVRFNDLRVSEPLQWRVGIWLSAARKSLQFVHISFSNGCTLRFRDPIADENLYVGTVPESCHTEKLPVLFLPGYGASVNLGHLAKALPVEPETNGWRFITPLTEPYRYMLDHLKQSGTPYKICFYDWRLPSAQIVEEYLRPAIDALRSATGASSVKIVAHSYGGLVARAYVQGSTYQGDVYQVIQVGTPNQGTVKAYGVWEGGVLPPDWQALENLVRYYMFINKAPTRLQTVRAMFPSVRELLPIYPSLFYRRTELADPAKLRQPNTTLLSLRDYVRYFTQRTRVTTVRSTELATVTTLLLKVPPAASKDLWTDGEPYLAQPAPPVSGDGTVPSESVEIDGAENLLAKGSHFELTASALDEIFEALSIGQPTVPPRYDRGRSAGNMLWFIFDCPVEVSVQLPDGRAVTSAEAPPVDSDLDVLASEEMVWFVVPSMPGQYRLSVTGLEDTPVRYWVNFGEIHEAAVRKGETLAVPYGSEVPTHEDPPPASPTDIPSPMPAGDLPAGVREEREDADLAPPGVAPATTTAASAADVPRQKFAIEEMAWLRPVAPKSYAQKQPVQRQALERLPEPARNSRRREMWLSLVIAVSVYVMYSATMSAARYCRSRRNVPP